MVYSDFTLLDLRKKFKLSNQVISLFKDTTLEELEPSPLLQQQLLEATELPIKSKKARSEFIITPILLELRRRNNKFFTIYSGDTLVGDKDKGLIGECDFIIAKDTGSFTINVPIITIVEAKRQDIELGINQCAAQLYGAMLLNKDLESPIQRLYGCVTTADDWKFMYLEKNKYFIDKRTYYKSEIGKILGIFQIIIDYYRGILK